VRWWAGRRRARLRPGHTRGLWREVPVMGHRWEALAGR